ncbi:MAG: hypothetical protein IIC64_12770 [SAR324 cluster bacterium]|nr:hypothetical protein [SAR324 cluster bacterium]
MRIEKAEESNLVGEATENEETPVWVVVSAVILVSIPLSLCCYLLLKYAL